MEELTLETLLAGIQSNDPDVRTDAWLSAGAVGAPAVKPLAGVMKNTAPDVARLAAKLAELQKAGASKDARKQLEEELDQPLEIGRAAKRGMWKIVRHAGRPGAGAEKAAVVAELIGLLGDDQPTAVRREVLWMLSEIGGDESVEAIAAMPGILENRDLREDARCAVERIPGNAAVRTLMEGFEAAPDDFKLNMAQSLRARGVEVDEKKYPCQKLVPTRG